MFTLWQDINFPDVVAKESVGIDIFKSGQVVGRCYVKLPITREFLD